MNQKIFQQTLENYEDAVAYQRQILNFHPTRGIRKCEIIIEKDYEKNVTHYKVIVRFY